MKFYESSLFYIAVALLLIAPFSGFAIVVFASCGVIVLWMDMLLRAVISDRKKLRIAQWFVLPVLALYWFLPRILPEPNDPVYLKVKLPPSFVGEVRIVAGVPNTPPLSSDTATIEIPPDGLFITSTRIGPEDSFGTDLGEQHLPFFVVAASPYNHSFGGYKTVLYRVSNIDSIRLVPDTFYNSRANVFFDSLTGAWLDARQ